MKKFKLLMPALGVATLASVVPAAVSCAKYETTECELNAYTYGESLIPKTITFSNKKVEKGKDFVTKVSWTVEPSEEGPKSLYAYSYEIHIGKHNLGQNTVDNPNGWVVLSHNDNEIEFKIPSAALGDIKQQKPQINFYFNFREADLDVLANLDTWSDDIWTDPEDDVHYRGLTTTVNVPAPEAEEPNKRVEVEIPLNKWANSQQLPQSDIVYFALVEDHDIVSISGISEPYLGLESLTYHYVTLYGKTVIAISTPKNGWGNLGNLNTINFYFATEKAHTNLKVSLIEPKSQFQQYNINASEYGTLIPTRTYTYSARQGIKGKDFETTVSWSGELFAEHQYVNTVDVYVDGDKIYQDHYNERTEGQPVYHIISKGYNSMTFVFDKELFAGKTGTPTISLVFDFQRSSIDKYVDVSSWNKTLEFNGTTYKNVLSSGFFRVSHGFLETNYYVEANIRMANYLDDDGKPTVPTDGQALYFAAFDCGETATEGTIINLSEEGANYGFRIGQYDLKATYQAEGDWNNWVKLEPETGYTWGQMIDAGKLSAINASVDFELDHSNIRFVLATDIQK